MEDKLKAALDCKMGPNDAKAATIKDYLKALLLGVWTEEENFDGKRPFGNSSWKHEVYTPLVAAQLVKGRLDEDGYAGDFDETGADDLIAEAIKAL